LEATAEVEKSMRNRGGGIVSIQLKNSDSCIQGYYQLEVVFNTMNAMGANFINTCLETMTAHMVQSAQKIGVSDNLEVIMAIVSNYTPQCLVECTVECAVSAFSSQQNEHNGKAFVRRFSLAVSMAHDISRAVTHNKGIFNGVDAVLIATGNDFRAVEAAGHAWAARNGTYRSLSEIELQDDQFQLRVTLPMPLGVVGGITNLHPMAKASLQLLGNPGAADLMSVACAAGLANHYSAIKALITQGIQHGHMKMHLLNILNQLEASVEEKELALQYFIYRTVSYADVREFLSVQRS
jgi:hydroxymethylglutaryl-CoA reductase